MAALVSERQDMIGAIEAGGTKIVCALAQPGSGNMVARARIDTVSPAVTFPQIRAFFHAAAADHGAIAAFGVASFGPLDIDPHSPGYGDFGNTPKLAWQGARWREALGGFGVPIAYDSDVDGAALGEWAAGAGRGCETLAYTTVGTGIGAGVIHAGHSRVGFSHYEAGHIRARRNPARDAFAGVCPAHGDCLEGLASGTAIAARWGHGLNDFADSAAPTELIAGYLGQLAAMLVLLHMPDRLVFGGGVMKSAGLIEALREATQAELGGYVDDPRLDPGLERYIVTPELGDDAGIVGAVLMGQRLLRQD